jgi:hypothetical protein
LFYDAKCFLSGRLIWSMFKGVRVWTQIIKEGVPRTPQASIITFAFPGIHEVSEIEMNHRDDPSRVRGILGDRRMTKMQRELIVH